MDFAQPPLNQIDGRPISTRFLIYHLSRTTDTVLSLSPVTTCPPIMDGFTISFLLFTVVVVLRHAAWLYSVGQRPDVQDIVDVCIFGIIIFIVDQDALSGNKRMFIVLCIILWCIVWDRIMAGERQQVTDPELGLMPRAAAATDVGRDDADKNVLHYPVSPALSGGTAGVNTSHTTGYKANSSASNRTSTSADDPIQGYAVPTPDGSKEKPTSSTETN